MHLPLSDGRIVMLGSLLSVEASLLSSMAIFKGGPTVASYGHLCPCNIGYILEHFAKDF